LETWLRLFTTIFAKYILFRYQNKTSLVNCDVIFISLNSGLFQTFENNNVLRLSLQFKKEGTHNWGEGVKVLTDEVQVIFSMFCP